MTDTGSQHPDPTVFAISSTTPPTFDADLITIRGLNLPQSIKSLDIWGQEKHQPAYLDVELQLSHGFKSAASQDKLDSTTVHYGHLSKGIRDLAFRRGGSVGDVFDTIAHYIWDSTTVRENGQHLSSLSAVRLTLSLPKATVYGDGCKIIHSHSLDSTTGLPTAPPYAIHLDRLKVMALIGVNANERIGKQALLVSCTFYTGRDIRPLSMTEDFYAILHYERRLIEAIETTDFETLEALAEHLSGKVLTELQDSMLLTAIRLRIEKPSAILYAEAPAIELIRRLAH